MEGKVEKMQSVKRTLLYNRVSCRNDGAKCTSLYNRVPYRMMGQSNNSECKIERMEHGQSFINYKMEVVKCI